MRSREIKYIFVKIEDNMQTELEKLISLYRELEIDKQIDYDKFYLYSLITHSTAIEGSTITELENQSCSTRESA